MSIRRVEFLICLAGFYGFFASPALGEKLTKAKLIELQEAGLSVDSLIGLVQKEGVDFAVDADVVLELKRASIPETVIQFLSRGSPTITPSASSLYGPAKQAYASGDYSKAAEALKSILKSNPSDARAQALLAMACMKARDTTCGESAYADLQKNTSVEAAPLRDRVAAAFQSLQEQDRVKQALQAALRRFDRDGLLAAIRESKLSAAEKNVLEAWMYIYAAEYEKAKTKLQGLPPDLALTLEPSFADFERRATVAQCALSWRFSDPGCPLPKSIIEEYTHDAKEAEAAIVSKSSLETFTTMARRSQARNLASLEGDVLELFRTAPLSQSAANYLFQMSFLMKPYGEAKAFNDNLLKSVGAVIIPVMAGKVSGMKTLTVEREVQRLTIDTRGGKLLISAGARWSEMWQALQRVYPDPNHQKMQDLSITPAQLSFGDIRSLRQKIKVSYGIPNFWDTETVILDLGSHFVVAGMPTFLQQIVDPEMGELVERQYMQDFGRYIWGLSAHSSGQEPNLIEVKASKPGASAFTKFLMLTADLATNIGAPAAIGRLDAHTLGLALESVYSNVLSASSPSSSTAEHQTWDQRAVENALEPLLNESLTKLQGLWTSVSDLPAVSPLQHQ